MSVILLAVAIFALVMLAMALGVIVRGKCLSGSCGGPTVTGADGRLVCGACGRRDTSQQETRVGQISFDNKPQ